MELTISLGALAAGLVILGAIHVSALRAEETARLSARLDEVLAVQRQGSGGGASSAPFGPPPRNRPIRPNGKKKRKDIKVAKAVG